SLANPHNRQIAQLGMNMGQDRHMKMVRGNGENQFRQCAGQNVGNLNGYNAVPNVGNQVIQNKAQNPRVQNISNLVAACADENAANENRIRDAAYLQTQLLIAQKEEAGIQLQAEEFDLIAATTDLDEIEKVNANCILMANLQQASTSGTKTDKAPVYDSDGSAEQAQKKQQSLYDGKMLLEKHDPPVVHDSEGTLQLAQESRLKMKQLNKEIKPANYTKINHLSGVFVSQMAKSREELYFLDISKTANVSKPISIPNEEFSDDTTPSVARKFLNE
nr:hypothetical protein [Tanacetum cinerariifolium]